MLCLCPESGTDKTKQTNKKRMGCLLTQSSNTVHPINCISPTFPGASFFFFIWFDWRLATHSRVHYRHLSRCPLHANANGSDSTAPPAGLNMNGLIQFSRSSPILVDQWQLEVWLWEESQVCSDESHSVTSAGVCDHTPAHTCPQPQITGKNHTRPQNQWCKKCNVSSVMEKEWLAPIILGSLGTWQQNLLFCCT